MPPVREWRRALAALAAAALACAPAVEPAPLDLGEYGLAVSPAPTALAPLAWQPPDASCPLAYRVRIDETFPPGLAEFLHSQEEHSEAVLVLGHGVLAKKTWSTGPAPRDEAFVGQLAYRGPKTGGRELLREWSASAALVGPASPDAACYERTWDPVEDALSLGWPQLPARRARVGETWTGARVEGRCDRAACIDPETRGGGAKAHHMPCTTMSWRERLVGVYALGDALVAQISSFWSDGQALDVGIWTERTALVDTDTGRLLRAEVFVHHGFMNLERLIRIDAIDGCPGGLVAAGWAPPERLTRERDALAGALERKPSRAR